MKIENIILNIQKELKTIKNYQEVLTLIELSRSWERILEMLIDLKIITPKGLGLNLTLKPKETKEFYLQLPPGYVCVCPFVELESSVKNVYFTFKFNPKELMKTIAKRIRLPDYFIDAPTNLINYQIPTQRVIRSIRLTPKWSVYLKFENENSEDTANVYFYIPFWAMPEEYAVNLWFRIFDKQNNILKKIAIEDISIEKSITQVMENE
jgi:hypothetical protein